MSANEVLRCLVMVKRGPRIFFGGTVAFTNLRQGAGCPVHMSSGSTFTIWRPPTHSVILLTKSAGWAPPANTPLAPNPTHPCACAVKKFATETEPASTVSAPPARVQGEIPVTLFTIPPPTRRIANVEVPTAWHKTVFFATLTPTPAVRAILVLSVMDRRLTLLTALAVRIIRLAMV